MMHPWRYLVGVPEIDDELAATVVRRAEYLLAGGATPDEFLSAAMFAASDFARRHGPLRPGFYLTAMNLSDEWDASTPDRRAGLIRQVEDLARAALGRFGEHE